MIIMCIHVDIGLAVLYIVLVAVFFEGLKAFRFYIAQIERHHGINKYEWSAHLIKPKLHDCENTPYFFQVVQSERGRQQEQMVSKSCSNAGCRSNHAVEQRLSLPLIAARGPRSSCTSSKACCRPSKSSSPCASCSSS